MRCNCYVATLLLRVASLRSAAAQLPDDNVLSTYYLSSYLMYVLFQLVRIVERGEEAAT